MTMDARDQFPVDMVEQMLKFTPSPEERVSIAHHPLCMLHFLLIHLYLLQALLDEHAEEIDHLARADRFLFELSK